MSNDLTSNLKMQRMEFEVGEQVLEYFKTNFSTTTERVKFLSGEWESHIPLNYTPSQMWESVFDVITDGALARDPIFLKTFKNTKNLLKVCRKLCAEFQQTTSEMDINGYSVTYIKNDVFKAFANSVDFTCFDLNKAEDKQAYDILVTVGAYFALHNNDNYLTDAVNYKNEPQNGFKYGEEPPKLSSMNFYVDVLDRMIDLMTAHHGNQIEMKNPKFLDLASYFSTVSSMDGFLEKINKETYQKEGHFLISLSWDETYRDRCYSNFAQFAAVNFALSTRNNEPELLKKLIKRVPNDLMHKEISFRTPSKIVTGFVFDAVIANLSSPLLQRGDADVEKFKESFALLINEFPYLKKNENTLNVLANTLEQNTGPGNIKRYNSSNMGMVLEFFDWKTMDKVFADRSLVSPCANDFCFAKKIEEVALQNASADKVERSYGSTFKL